MEMGDGMGWDGMPATEARGSENGVRLSMFFPPWGWGWGNRGGKQRFSFHLFLSFFLLGWIGGKGGDARFGRVLFCLSH